MLINLIIIKDFQGFFKDNFFLHGVLRISRRRGNPSPTRIKLTYTPKISYCILAFRPKPCNCLTF